MFKKDSRQSQKNFNQLKHYSTASAFSLQDLYDQKSDFLNWFSGFTVAEGHFGIVKFRGRERT